ncbi:MAG: CoA pyrophosphatase [Pseudomonadales bacterium]|jgi:8-oxo-dGTP pyrophosphatase MutT (NUDIX family)|nr:CoA pyrophosphatase [Pseudomonadales bacterium]MDP6470513.1 CoA pyrophosphatase [Pseudomonadales bacterium]MDP6827815.1 CoA pyrophosphatase [Pseudomonadales bacterium]MDP6972987.1 CoA pyrophosphatase [Pseudomonadales bacterium]|tara:strand:- start:1148 stop:1807 length:660 start_codon:yes stop_codon:yes gene_type:complete
MQCDDDLKQRIANNLSSFEVVENKVDDAHHAAVVITVVDVGHGADLPGLPRHAVWQHQAGLLLTRRSQHLKNHPGQWAFPGGRLDPGESVVQTALREMHEEVGLNLDHSSVLGVLDDFVTRSGFVMTPVVVWGGPSMNTEHNPDEVASVHRIPCEEFLREDAPWLDEQEGSEELVLRMPVGNDFIAAPTAALLYQFREVCLLGVHTRVAHFEQPHFAWK